MEENFAIETADKLRTELFKEILKASKENRLTGSLLVSKTRDYNRKWNKLAEIHPDLIEDGFKVFAKKIFIEEYGADPDFVNDIGMEQKGLEFSEYMPKESLAQQGGYGLTNKGPQHDEA